MPAFVESATLLFVLLNPFLLSIYLLDLVQKLTPGSLAKVLSRAALISLLAFSAFAVAGDAIFARVLHVRFAAFQIFGGVLFLVIAVRFVQLGVGAIGSLRGETRHLAGAIAMPFMIGPGTIGASIVIGSRLSAVLAVAAVAAGLAATVATVFVLKLLHDYVKERNEPLVERYIEIVGRASALFIGTISVEMILQGVDLWLGRA